MTKLGNIVFGVYIVFGLYLINSSFSFISMPQFLLNFQNWIELIMGGLLILGGYFFSQYNKHNY